MEEFQYNGHCEVGFSILKVTMRAINHFINHGTPLHVNAFWCQSCVTGLCSPLDSNLCQESWLNVCTSISYHPAPLLSLSASSHACALCIMPNMECLMIWASSILYVSKENQFLSQYLLYRDSMQLTCSSTYFVHMIQVH